MDYNCSIDDLCKIDNVFLKVLAVNNMAAFYADEKVIPWLKEKFNDYSGEWIFEVGVMRAIDKKINEFGYELEDLHLYYIPKDDKVIEYDIKWFEKDELAQFEDNDDFGEALMFDEEHPDMLAVVALDGDKIIGMAGASRDSELMWQVGINTLPGYRGKRVGTTLTSLLKNKILSMGIVPFYGTGASHNVSKNIAINTGFIPYWAELKAGEK